jgi:hypothetical protein
LLLCTLFSCIAALHTRESDRVSSTTRNDDDDDDQQSFASKSPGAPPSHSAALLSRSCLSRTNIPSFHDGTASPQTTYGDPRIGHQPSLFYSSDTGSWEMGVVLRRTFRELVGVLARVEEQASERTHCRLATLYFMTDGHWSTSMLLDVTLEMRINVHSCSEALSRSKNVTPHLIRG